MSSRGLASTLRFTSAQVLPPRSPGHRRSARRAHISAHLFIEHRGIFGLLVAEMPDQFRKCHAGFLQGSTYYAKSKAILRFCGIMGHPLPDPHGPD
jgi:hypothetical protein